MTARRALVLVAIAVIAVAGVAAHLQRPPRLPAGGTLVVIRTGDSLDAIATRLARARVIRSPLLFRLWARARGLDRALQPGEYRFARPQPVADVVARLAAGSPADAVTIPEGLTLREIAALLAARGFGPAESVLCLADDAEFLLSAGVPGPQLEGYLFPDTYRFTPLMGARAIVRTMVRRFHERMTADVHRRAAARALTLHQLVTLASIVEKETGQAAERPLVAAVFVNRLRRGMPLQSDPTVIYALPAFDGNLTRADLAWPSPYNTYVMPGLPPGPIANPGLAAIEAVLEPADVPYLYFVSRNDGSHVFSSTLAEHNRAVARYQRGGSR